MKAILFFVVLSVIFFSAPDISMMGLKINGSQKSLKSVKLKVISKEDETTKYRTENGNDFSVTVDEGKIVFMQNDWSHSPDGAVPLFSDFKFGQTSLTDIRKALGTNGYTYDERDNMTTETDLVEFNCFEFDSPNNEVLVTITKAPLTADLTGDNIPDNLKLDGIIIAGKKFMEQIWGSKKHFDPHYKKISLDEL